MKKLVLTLSVVAIAACSYAQGVSGGLKGGVNFTNFSGDLPSTDMKIGFHGGAYVNFGITESFSIQPELLYNTAGAKWTEESGYGDAEYTFKLSYISIPVMAVYSFGNFNIQAGPQISLLTKADIKFEQGGQSDEEDFKDYLASTDFGLNLGLGYSFGKVNATARYTLGLSNIADSEDFFGGSDFEIKTSAIQVSVGVKIFGE